MNTQNRKEALSRLPGTDVLKPQNTNKHTYNTKTPSNDQRVRALFDMWEFIDLIGFHGGTSEFNKELHKEVVDFVTQTQTDNVLKRSRFGLLPRGHYKSTIGTVLYTLWRIYRNPDIRICVGTATKMLATTFVREIKQYLEDVDLQERVWNNRPHITGRMIPVLDRVAEDRRAHKRKQEYDEDEGYTEAQDKKIVWRSDAIQVIRTTINREPTVVVASLGTSITGMHFDLVILDDIVDKKNTATPILREKTHQWVRDLESIVDPERSVKFGNYVEVVGREFVVWGTRYHKEDYYAYLLDNLEDLGYSHIFKNVYKNGEDSTHGYIFPERFTDAVIESIRKRQGFIYFATQYLNKVVSSEDVIFEPSAIKYVLPSSISEVSEYSRGHISVFDKDKLRHDFRPIMVIDPAISQKKTADYSVILIGGLDHDRNFFVVDLEYGRWLPNVLVEKTYELADNYGLSSVYIEVVGFQAALISMFKMQFHQHRPISLLEYKPKGDKQGRIKMHLQPLFDNAMIYLVQKLANCKELQEELNYFPTVHDDLLDAMAMCVELSTPAPKKKETLFGMSENISRAGSFLINNKYGGRFR